MKPFQSVLILDDDPVVLKLLSGRIKKRFPDVHVDGQEQPVAVGAYDIYILDNDFHGRPLAADLAEHIKKQQPNSLVLALSGTLDAHTLKRLINCGCAGAFEKSAPAEIDSLIAMIDDHLKEDRYARDGSSRPQNRVGETARAIASLIHNWNRRLELEEMRERRDRANPTTPHTEDLGYQRNKGVEWEGENVGI